MFINHNMSAIFANRQLKVNNWALDKNMEKLSSGSRIPRAGNDASGLAVSEKLRSQIRGLRQASANALAAVPVLTGNARHSRPKRAVNSPSRARDQSSPS